MALHRAQILLEADQHRELEKRARESGRSISELVREITAEYLERTSGEESLRRALAALDAMDESRREIERRHGVLPLTFLDDIEPDRDAELIP
jgi:Ribbon-helix-helix protein, copG family